LSNGPTNFGAFKSTERTYTLDQRDLCLSNTLEVKLGLGNSPGAVQYTAIVAIAGHFLGKCFHLLRKCRVGADTPTKAMTIGVATGPALAGLRARAGTLRRIASIGGNLPLARHCQAAADFLLDASAA
jgi:hypothetical protein